MNRTIDLKILPLFLLLIISLSLNAQKDSLASPEKNKFFKNVDFSGNVDMYYRYSVNETPSSTSMVYNHNSFSIGWLSLGLEKEGKKTGFATNFAFGPRVEEYFGGGTAGLGNIRDLYAWWNLTPKIKGTLGITQPFIGYEADEAHPNWLYSGSYGYSFLPPPSVTGLQFEFELTDDWTALMGLYNSSLARIDFDNTKHFGAQLMYEKGISNIKVGVLTGQEPDSSNTLIAEWIGDFQLSERFTLGSNMLYYTQTFQDGSDLSWSIITLYGKLQMEENYYIALRGEYVSDPDGNLFGVLENGVSSFTLAFNWQIENLHLRPEIRIDSSRNPTFFETESATFGHTDSHIMLGVMYNF